jgi:hypothetical protein
LSFEEEAIFEGEVKLEQ